MFLALVATADVVVESFRPGVVDRLGIGYGRSSESTRDHPVLHHRIRPERAACRLGRARHQLPGRRGLPGHHRAPGRRRSAGIGGHHRRRRRRRHAGGPGRDGRTHRTGEDGPGTHLDVSIADGVLWITSLAVDEHLATGAPVGPGHNIITGRYACYDTYQAADGGWLAVGAIEPKFFANLCRLLGASSGRPTSWTTTPRTRSVPTSGRRLRHPAPGAPGWTHWPGPTPASRRCCPWTSWSTTSSTRPGAPSSRRWSSPTATPRGGSARWARSWPAVAPIGPIEVADTADPALTDTDRLLGAAGLTRIASPNCGTRGWWHECHRRSRHRRTDRGGAVRGTGRVPGGAGLCVDHLLLGGERQPVVLGPGGGRRGDRWTHRSPDDGVGLVPPPSLGPRTAPPRVSPSRSIST